MKVGSLFSGGGLGDFGFMAAGMDITWQCEIDEYCHKILTLRYPESRKYTDIKTLKGAELEPVDIITGGFPCQPFSVAGKQKGKEDNRYLWPEMLRIIKECRPRWVIGENVPGIINMALDNVCSDLEGEGYEVWPIVFPSHALGAWHKRDRLWLICHAKQSGPQGYTWDVTGGNQSRRNETSALRSAPASGILRTMADASSTGRWSGEESAIEGKETAYRSEVMADSRLLGQEKPKEQAMGVKQLCEGFWREYWNAEPTVGRVANGIADRVHRLKMLGNGQVAVCTYVIGKMIVEIEKEIFERNE